MIDLESKAILAAIEIQQELNENTKVIASLNEHVERLRKKNSELTMQLETLKEDYKECKL